MNENKSKKIRYLPATLFHNNIAENIQDNYDVKVLWTKVIAWGYQTIGVYMEDVNHKKYIIKLTRKEYEKKEKMIRSILVEEYLYDKIPSALYVKNTNDDWITEYSNGEYGDYLLRLQHHIEGVPAFDMTFDILSQTIDYLKIIHSSEPPHIALPTYESTREIDYKLLHGDLTPSNILVSFGNVTGILDFEECMLGPVEFDLSRLAVFSWFRMSDIAYDEVLKKTLELYGIQKYDLKWLHELSVHQLEERLANLEKYRHEYEDDKPWKDDYDYTSKKLGEIRKLL